MNGVWVKDVRLASLAFHSFQPLRQVLVFWIFVIANCRQEPLIATNTATIIRWTCHLSSSALWIGYRVLSEQDVFKVNGVFPRVPHVVQVVRLAVLLVKEAGEFLALVRLHRRGVFIGKPFVIGTAIPFRFACLWVQNRELMEVIVQPAKGICNGNVKIPEGIAIGDFNPALDNRRHTFQGNLETENLLEGLPARVGKRKDLIRIV